MTALATTWRRPAVRAFVWQALALALVAAFALWLYTNVTGNLARRNLDVNFGFLAGRASFEFGENLAGYRPGDSFFRAFLAGLANTVQVAVLGILLTTVVATMLALLRLSRNRLASRLAWGWIEAVRNTPLLLQLLFWHQLVIRSLPGPRAAWQPLPDVFVTNRGVFFPVPIEGAVAWQLLAAVAAGAALGTLLARVTGRRAWWLLALAAPALLLALTGAPDLTRPALRGFNFRGGASVSPEFVALLLALVIYQSGFMAETIRSGILGVPKGQVEAANALGLRRAQQLRFVIFPQALRIVIPPVTSQYLSLTKNSSLAVAIGYPDLVRVSQVTISETGRAVECIAILLAVYLSLSLLTAVLMNLYNRRVMRRGGAR